MSAPPVKVALITGASGGLGRALVNEFTRANWQVIAASRQVQGEAFDKVLPVQLDVGNSDSVLHAIATAITTFGRIDCLVNNAAATADAPLWQLSDEAWDEVLNVNLRGAFFCARAVARHLTKQRDGHIINIASFAGRAGARGQANYAAAKAGLFGLTQSLAKELGSRNVRVNAVLPGVLPTRMTAKLSEEQMQQFASANALGRINSLDEVARFLVFLAGTQNISGQLFQLDSRIAPWT